MNREEQLRERDVRREAPEQNPSEFMNRYLASNFPQTMGIPSKDQKDLRLPMTNKADPLNLKKKPLSGIQYDNPGVS